METLFRLLLGNIILLYTGACLRYIYKKYLRRKKIKFNNILHGIEEAKTKQDEKYNVDNEFVNKSYGCFILLILIIIMLIIVQ